MKDTMLALRFEAWGEPAKLREIPVPTIDSDGILLKITAAGMCHSDLHVMDAEPGQMPFEPPFTLGHEAAGTVVAVGANVDNSWINRDVVVHGIWGCRTCRRCRAGRQNYCLNRGPAVGNGLGRDGGLAEFMAVPSVDYLVPADGLDPRQAAPLTDAALTAFHAVKPQLDSLGEDSRVLVIGAGGLGHFAVQLLASTPTTILVVDPKAEARELALSLGARQAFADLSEVRSIAQTPEDRFDAVYDFVATSTTMQAAISLTALGGHAQVIGSAGGVLEVGKNLGLPQGWTVSAPFWGPKPDLAAVVDMARAGQLTAHTETFALTEVESAYERLRAGEISGRAVVLPQN